MIFIEFPLTTEKAQALGSIIKLLPVQSATKIYASDKICNIVACISRLQIAVYETGPCDIYTERKPIERKV
jgi:hypothetical protein